MENSFLKIILDTRGWLMPTASASFTCVKPRRAMSALTSSLTSSLVLTAF